MIMLWGFFAIGRNVLRPYLSDDAGATGGAVSPAPEAAIAANNDETAEVADFEPTRQASDVDDIDGKGEQSDSEIEPAERVDTLDEIEAAVDASEETSELPEDVVVDETDEADEADEQEEEAGEEEEADEPDDSPSVTELEAQISKLRRQSARRRVERNAAREQLSAANIRIAELEQTGEARIAELEQKLQAAQAGPDPARAAEDRAAIAELRALRAELAGESGISVATLRAIDALSRAKDESTLREALTQLHGSLGATWSAPSLAPNPTPPDKPTQPLTLRDQIAEAEQSGTLKERLALKAKQLSELQRPT
jgi:hypothetical protein